MTLEAPRQSLHIGGITVHADHIEGLYQTSVHGPGANKADTDTMLTQIKTQYFANAS